MKRLILMLLALFLVLSGCGATSMLLGSNEPDLTKIALGGQRSQVEKILGKRLWNLGLEGGLTYDIYQYTASQQAQPIKGALLFGLDYLLLGLPEIAGSMDNDVDFDPVKQVCVAYDEQDFIRFVSQPWPVGSIGACRSMRSRLPANYGLPLAARPSSAVTKHSVSEQNLAVIEIEWDIYGTIDGREIESPKLSVQAKVIELQPGSHAFRDNYGASLQFELFSGRLYRLKSARGTLRKGFKILWIEDVASSETLACWYALPLNETWRRDINY